MKIKKALQFGGYDWKILDIKDGKALVISENTVSTRGYHTSSDDITWEHCEMREYLNGEFLDSIFSAAEKARIAETVIVNSDNGSATGGNTTTDKVFLLSIDEANQYFGDDTARVAYTANGVAAGWWLRSPGRSSSYASLVDYTGGIDVQGGGVAISHGSVRPALWLTIE